MVVYYIIRGYTLPLSSTLFTHVLTFLRNPEKIIHQFIIHTVYSVHVFGKVVCIYMYSQELVSYRKQ
jgi:hypothetical protein